MPSPSRAEVRGAPRVPVPTPLLVRAALSLLVLAAAVPLVPALERVWLAVAALLALLLGLDVLLRPGRGAVEVGRELAAVQYVGRDSGYTVWITNRETRELVVALGETLPPGLAGVGLEAEVRLAPGASARWEVALQGLARGSHALAAPVLRVQHPLGLLVWQERPALDDRVVVAPGRPAGETEWLLSRVATLEEMGQRTIRRLGAAQEFESLREYVVGDELRRIDWRASARRFRPMVRQYRVERNAELILALDCGRLMSALVDGVTKLDLAMTSVLDLAAVALRRGERVGFLAFDARPLAYLPPRSGLDKLQAIQRALGELPASAEPTSHLRAASHLEAHHRKRCLIVVFTDFTDELSAHEMHATLAALTRRHALVFVAVGDPHLQRLFEAEASDAQSLFEQAVAGDLLAERRRVLTGLERLGVPTVDADPFRLSGPLIRRYLDVRYRGAS